MFAIPSHKIYKPTPKIVLHLLAAKVLFIKMLNTLLPILLLIFFSARQVEGQVSTISVGPLLTCGLTTFSCPGVSGCCTIAGCCGSGCCANGYTCIYEGTPQQTCCPASDPTKCGTVTPVSPIEQTCYFAVTVVKPTLIILRDTVVRFWIRFAHLHDNSGLSTGSRPRFGLDVSPRTDMRALL